VGRREEIVVGVNRYVDTSESEVAIPTQAIDEEATARQVDRVRAYRITQDAEAVSAALARVDTAARGDDRLLPVMREALVAGATLGQVVATLRPVFGSHRG